MEEILQKRQCNLPIFSGKMEDKPPGDPPISQQKWREHPPLSISEMIHFRCFAIHFCLLPTSELSRSRLEIPCFSSRKQVSGDFADQHWDWIRISSSAKFPQMLPPNHPKLKKNGKTNGLGYLSFRKVTIF